MIQRGKRVEMGADNLAKVDSGLPPTLARWRRLWGQSGDSYPIPKTGIGSSPRFEASCAPGALWGSLHLPPACYIEAELINQFAEVYHQTGFQPYASCRIRPDCPHPTRADP